MNSWLMPVGCGGKVDQTPGVGWGCDRCSARWSFSQWGRMDHAAYSKRFERIYPVAETTQPRGERWKLEEVEEGKRRFLRTRKL